MAGNLHGVLIDYEKEMPEVIISFFINEIRADQRETMERCAVHLEQVAADGQALNWDTVEILAYQQAANEIRALITELEEE